MYLRSLKLVGFKSFADRTRLEFEPGVSVVVGPNGAGKSNIVDAVAWVMGTQSTRTLRTEAMEDVIFAGTATRPALGRAEVTLIFDNADRELPLDLDDVSITRRLFRDGTSEYEINGVDCRLLDIQELLSDSGVGCQQHVIVGQGQIDTILNAKEISTAKPLRKRQASSNIGSAKTVPSGGWREPTPTCCDCATSHGS